MAFHTWLNCHFQFEEGAKEAADESTRPRPEGEEDIQDIQVTLKSDANPDGIRYLKVYVCGYFDIFTPLTCNLFTQFPSMLSSEASFAVSRLVVVLK